MKSAEQILPFPLSFIRLPKFDLWRMFNLINYTLGFVAGFIFYQRQAPIFFGGSISSGFVSHLLVCIILFSIYAYFLATINVRNLVIGVSKRWRLVFSEHVNHSITLIIYHGRNYHERMFYNYIPGKFCGKWTCSTSGDAPNNPPMVLLHPFTIGVFKIITMISMFILGFGFGRIGM